MVALEELKEWLRVDGNDEDVTLNALIKSSEFIIKQASGVESDDLISDTQAAELYKLVQKLIITDLYENRIGSTQTNPMVISFCTQLEAFKLTGGDA